MNVGLVVPGFSADASDWCIPALRHLARALALSEDVRVFAVRYPYRVARYRVEGAEVIALGGAVRRGAGTFALWRTTIEVIRAEHRRRPFDVLHAFWATESGLLTGLAGRLLHIPTLVSLAGGELVALRDIDYGDQLLAWERLKVNATLRLTNAVSAGSQLLLDVAKRFVPPSRLHRAPLGVDVERFTPNGVEPDPQGSQALPAQSEPRFVHVGTLTAVKDQRTLLRAFARLHQAGTGATLDIVGDGPLRPELERLAEKLRLDGAVRFRGAIDHGLLPSVYSGAGAFVLSSRHEAQGMVALEAGACGVPVVGTRVGIVPELTSALSPVAADDRLAEAMAACLANGAPRSDLLAHVRADFGLHPCTERFRGLYTTLAAPV